MKIKLAVLLTALVISGLAFSQATLGSIVKLGSSTTAGLPASSATIAGGLIYLSDDAGVLWNDGTKWNTFSSGGGGSSSYWYDGGVVTLLGGTIFANEPLNNPDGGTALRLINVPPSAFPQVKASMALALGGQDQTFGMDWVGLRIGRDVTPTSAPYGTISTANDGSTTAGSAHYPAVGTTTGMTLSSAQVGFASSDWGWRIGYFFQGNSAGQGRLVMETTTGNDAIKLTTGAQVHLGGGSLDYFASDGVGNASGSYVKLGEYTDAGFPAVSTTNRGAVGWSSSSNSLLYSPGTAGTQWLPVTPFSMYGSAGYATSPINNTSVLGLAYAQAPMVSSHVSCLWSGGTGGTTGVVMSLTSPLGYVYCTCAVGACTANTGDCNCPGSISPGLVLLSYNKVYIDGGAASDCTLNPVELKCNVN